MALRHSKSISSSDLALSTKLLILSTVPDPPGAHSPDEGPIAGRKGSLNYRWVGLIQEIREAMLSVVDSVPVHVLDASETSWIAVTARFVEAKLVFEHGSNGAFASLSLPGAKIVGHLLKSSLQVISGTQTYLLHCQSYQDYIQCAAALFAWSNTRKPGLESKKWITPGQRLGSNDENLLLCKVEAHFTASSDSNNDSWQHMVGKLSRAGILTLIKDRRSVFQLDLTKVSAGAVRRVDPSLVNGRWVVFVVPDLGGPESVYLKFSSDDDLDDWFVSLRSFTRHEVYTTPDYDAMSSVRYSKNLKVSGVGIRLDDPTNQFSFANTYIDLCFDDWIWARTYINLTADAPYWHQEFVFWDIEDVDSPLELNLRASEESDVPNEWAPSLGKAYISGTDRDQWYRLDNSYAPVSVNPSVTIERIPVLDAKYYKPLRSQLMNFPLQIAYKLGDSMVTDIPVLSDIFFHIYLSESRQTEWMESLIDAEIAKYNNDASVSVMFRGNTMMTRGLERYLQTIGRDVLIGTVGRAVKKVLASTDSFELDPSRLHGSEAEIGKSLRLNRITTLSHLEYLWNLILKIGVPQSIEYVFTYLARSMREKLGASDDKISSAFSAFLFLRFYCPALLNPQLFGLVDKIIPSENQRSLTILAKILQGFANRIQFGGKEAWLASMNDFLNAHDGELINWYKSIGSYAGSKRPVERAPKQLPNRQFMRNELTNPYLIDVWAYYSKLALWAADVTFNPGWDASLRVFFLECKQIHNVQQQIISNLEKPDDIKHVAEILKSLDIRVNWETLVFGTDPIVLRTDTTPIKIDQRRKGWRLFNRVS